MCPRHCYKQLTHIKPFNPQENPIKCILYHPCSHWELNGGRENWITSLSWYNQQTVGVLFAIGQYSCSYNVSIPVLTSRPAVVGFVLFCLCINRRNGLFNFIGPIILLPFQLTAILLWLFLQIKLLTCAVLFSSQWLSFKLKFLTVTGELVPSLYFVTSCCLIHLFLLGMYPIPSPTERNIGHKLGWVLSDVLV